MCSWAKYKEDTDRIVQGREYDMNFDGQENPPKYKPIPKEASKNQLRREAYKNRNNIFYPKKGRLAIDYFHNRLTLKFSEYLFEEWVQALKDEGWRWDYYEKLWYNQRSRKNYDFGYKFITGHEKYD